MGRNAKKGGKAKQAAPSKSKKVKNVFKVNDAKGKKKPRKLQCKLKKIKVAVQNKQESVDASLKNLHKDMVVKKPTAKPSPAAKKPKKAPANTKNVSNKLGDLKV